MTELEKDQAVNGFIEMVSGHILKFYYLMGLKSHIEANVINDATGEEFTFSFKKKQSTQKEEQS